MADKTFIGMPIVGETYTPSNKKSPQLSDEEVSKLVHDVLESPMINAIGWDQYTPYYNDGESCVFRVGELFLSFDCEVDEDEYEADSTWANSDAEYNGRYWFNDYNDEFRTLVGDNRVDWTGDWPNRVSHLKTPINEAPNPELFQAYLSLSNAMDSGSCDDVFLRTFGDHANIIIDKKTGKVIVEEVEHD